MDDDIGVARTLGSDEADVADGTLSVADASDPTLPQDASFVRDPESPAQIGRYRVLRKLGGGGMGVVYAGHDPELDRTVAIKVVRQRLDGSPALEERLRREAQALARLHHPNVVSVHDVGVDDGRLYIVMQFVDGVPLDDWLAEHKPPLARIVTLFLDAGRGLAAAHAAGLVHRDFKPGNVLVERNGTVRVTDFGLARLSHLSDVPLGESGDGALGRSMTRGDVVGTPAYMAPEQFLGGAISPATDQFGYCVSLWLALTGKRPFTGDSFDNLRNAVVTGAIEPIPRTLPRRIQRVLQRGLALRATDRFADMNALLAALAPPRRRWIGVVAVLALAGAGTAIAMTMLGGRAPANPCRGVDTAIDEVWTPPQRDQIQSAVAALASSDAPAVALAVVQELDQRVATWRTMRLDTCAASQVRHDEDATVTARRLACLDRSLTAIHSAVDLLAGELTPTQRASAPAIARAGDDPGNCTAAGTLGAAPDRATSPELARRLADLESHARAGDDAFVLDRGPALAGELETAGDPGDAARAWNAIASLGRALPNKTAREYARKAATLAQQAGDDDLAAKSWARLAKLAGQSGTAPGDVDDLLAMARTAAARSAQPMTQMIVDVNQGYVVSYRGDQAKAAQICQKVVVDGTAAYGASSPPVEAALACLTHAYYHDKKWADALRVTRQRLEVTRTLTGPDSAGYLDVEEDLALTTFRSGDAVTGRANMAKVIDGLVRLYGAESARVMEAWWQLAQVESDDGAVATPEALAASKHAIELAAKVLPDDDPKRAHVLETQANLLSASGDHAGASAAFEVALGIYDRAGDPDSWAATAYNAATEYVNAGQCDRAMPLLERIVKIADARQIGSEIGASARGALGVCQARSGQFAEGVATLNATIATLDALGEADFAADYRLELADAYAKHGDRARARALAARAVANIPDDSPEHHQLHQRADAYRH